MKRTVACLLALIMLMALFSCGKEDTVPKDSEGLAYTALSETTCEVGGRGSCLDEEIRIPEASPDGKKVVAVGGYAFQNDTTLKKISFPKTVTSFGAYAFAGCSSLEQLSFPDQLESIGIYAFSRCSSLTTVYLGSSLVDVDDGAFSGCGEMNYCFFRGDSTQFGRVRVGNGNSAMTMNLYYYSVKQPTTSGKFWYYQNGSVRIW